MHLMERFEFQGVIVRKYIHGVRAPNVEEVRRGFDEMCSELAIVLDAATRENEPPDVVIAALISPEREEAQAARGLFSRMMLVADKRNQASREIMHLWAPVFSPRRPPFAPPPGGPDSWMEVVAREFLAAWSRALKHSPSAGISRLVENTRVWLSRDPPAAFGQERSGEAGAVSGLPSPCTEEQFSDPKSYIEAVPCHLDEPE